MESGLFAAGAACGCLQGASRASRLRGQLGFFLTTQPSRVVLFIYLFCERVCFHFSLCIYVKKKAVNLLLAAVLWPGLHGTLGSLAEFFFSGEAARDPPVLQSCGQFSVWQGKSSCCERENKYRKKEKSS